MHVDGSHFKGHSIADLQNMRTLAAKRNLVFMDDVGCQAS